MFTFEEGIPLFRSINSFNELKLLSLVIIIGQTLIGDKRGGNNTKVNKTPGVHNREDRLKTNIRWYLVKVWKLKGRTSSQGI